MHELLFICVSVSEIGFYTFYLLRDNYLFVLLVFLSSIDIVLMLAHALSAFVELGYVNHDFFSLF